MELTPRTQTSEQPSEGESQSEGTGPGDEAALRRNRARRHRLLSLGAIAVVLLALGVVVFNGLSNATVYFLNADEAVEQRDSLGSKRFRLQGMVQEGVTETSEGVAFEVRHNGVPVDVRHVGDPPQMFEPGIPVVLEGRWSDSGDRFDSDTMLVKHDAEYQSEEDYEERMSEVEGEAPSE